MDKRDSEDLEDIWARIPEGLEAAQKERIFRREVRKLGSPTAPEIDEFLRGKGLLI